MRLFAALVPPEEVLDELAEAVTPVREARPGLRWLSRELWHVTLAFYGELDEAGLERLLPGLERLLPGLERAARGPAPRLALSGGGAFPGASRARVLWAGLEGELQGLAVLADASAEAGREAGTAEDRRGYHAHLTLARSRLPGDLRPLVDDLAGFRGAEWRAEEVVLFRSRHGVPRYEPLRSWRLAED
jgi:2'-5' RNA ligase